MNPSRGTLLYSARFPLVLQVFQVIGYVLATAILLGLVGILTAVGLAAADSAQMVAVIIASAALGLLTIAALATIGWRGTRLAMNVTTRGIDVRGFLRDRWIPWPQVKVIEQSSHWYWRRATCVVMKDGQQIVPSITAHQYLFYRGEPRTAADRNPAIPQLPTRIAIDVHRRWLDGEFSRSA